VTLWTILSIPALMILVCFIIEILNLWHARVELETALEAAALAAVKEWGENPGTDTLRPRCTGVEYAEANLVGRVPLEITNNYNASATDPSTSNQNLSCDGDLIFGAITTDEPPWEFDTTEIPSCGKGNVLIDASEQGGLTTANKHEWGIAYQRADNTTVLPKISSIVIDLGATTPLYFDDTAGSSFGFADAATPYKVGDTATSQADFFGLNPATEITPTFSDPHPTVSNRYKKLMFTFAIDGGSGLPVFDPCERFRFGVNVRAATGGKQYDGDAMGDFGVTVTVNFSDSTSSSGTLVNTDSKGLPCGPKVTDSFCPNSGIYINNIPDLPCPPASGAGNDGQSYVRIGGSGNGKFGVRAQATVAVPTICENLFGISLPQMKVQAKTTALFDCNEPANPRLIRVLPENYNCVAP
jgi:hypothetical protein